MANDTPKLQSWQIFHFARKRLGRSALYAMFGKKNARAIDHYSEDPRTTAREEGAYNPIEGCKRLIAALDDHGYFGEVRATAAYLFEGTCAEFDHVQKIVEPKATMTEEKLLDYQKVGEFQKQIDTGADAEEVERSLDEAVAELERTFALYRQRQGGRE